jgi:hypothetical protein
MANHSNRRLKELMKVESYLIRTLRTFTSPSGNTIGEGSVIYYPKHVAENMVKCGWGVRVAGVTPQIV